MKTLSRVLITVATVMFIFGLQVVSAKADEQPFEFNQIEQDVRTAILDSQEVDLAGQTIRGEAIVTMWSDPALKDIPFFKIKNAEIVGDINAEGISLPFLVDFKNCTFDNNINLDSAKTKTFRIENDPNISSPSRSKVKGYVRMGRMFVDGDLLLYETEFTGPVTLYDAHINNNLYAKNSKFLGAAWPNKESQYPFELWTIYVGEKTEFTGALFKGDVMAANAEFNEEVDFDGATFEQKADFTNFKVGNYANFQGAKFQGDAIFESSRVQRDAAFTGAVFEKYANFNYFVSTRFMDLNKVTFNDFDFTYTNIGWPYFEGSTFNGHVDFEGMETSNDFDFTNATYTKTDEPLKVYDTKVGGRVLFKGFSAPAGLNLSNNQFGSLNITGGANKSFKEINLDATKITGQLYIENMNVENFSAQDMSVNDSTTFMYLTTSHSLNLSNASLGFFTISDEQSQFWPLGNQSDFKLLGTIYSDIRFATLNVSQSNSVDQSANTGDESQTQDHNYHEPQLVYQELNGSRKDQLDNMVEASVYSPQAYQTLEHFFSEKGHPSWADDLELKRRERERQDPEILARGSASWWWSWFLWEFSGYGQHPEFAFRWSLVIVLVGAIFFALTGNYNDQENEDKAKKQKDNMSNFKKFVYCLLYSAALFFPLSVLKFAEGWEPASDRSYFKLYQLIHRILGMIIAPTAVLALGGWIK